ncbi:unnamed protein product [Ectocarpus sp. CCAP 1310/34]|nr:unnamed protein product [Ectocarpus sp. CCAP 1310/34]
MARLARGRLAAERYAESIQVTTIAALCALVGGEDLFIVLGTYSLLRWQMYKQLVAATTIEGIRFDYFERIGGFDFKELLRFEKPHFLDLLGALQLPNTFEVSRWGYGVQRVPARLAFAVTLWRLAAPRTLIRDRIFWGMSETLICEIFNLTIEVIFERWGHLVNDLQVDAILPRIDSFCEAIAGRGSPLTRCWGFLDGTIRKIAPPWQNQRIYDNGWKRVHLLKYQAVDSPDGITRQLWGPVLGRRHDVTLLGLSGLLETLMQSFNDAAGVPYYIYGDPAYQVSPWLMAPFKGLLSVAKVAFIRAMSRVRVAVEWGFGRVVALWPYVDYVKKRQVALSACGLGRQYAVAGILTNCPCCFNLNSTAKLFDLTPPSLQEYLSGEG